MKFLFLSMMMSGWMTPKLASIYCPVWISLMLLAWLEALAESLVSSIQLLTRVFASIRGLTSTFMMFTFVEQLGLWDYASAPGPSP